jgi:putative membrane-bound dehydrogenase-like protein
MPLRLICILLLAALALHAADEAPELVPVEGMGLRLAKGFRITQIADHTLANDIFSMTLDSKGRIVVSSAGWIKTLIDKDGDGKPDEAQLFVNTGTGSMGLCFYGSDCYSSCDQAFSIFRDNDGNGKADGGPERFTSLSYGEHGAHQPRKGPDGCWYVITGNDANLGARHATLPNSPVKSPQAGGIVRFTPDGKQSDVIVHGLRNPYRFDFNADGELITYDSDCERDYFLPWYTPTRMYHLAYGMNHGWRLNGWQRSFARNDFFADNVDMLWPVGRGSPTGVVCYRHTQFPAHYRGGVFAMDWTFGKVYFFQLTPDGASYKTKLEVFLEPTGTEGFAPTDIVVAPDGSLLISIGGRRTRGGIYRVEYAKPSEDPAPGAPFGALGAVLRAPQPLDAWSRANWEPMAKNLGAKAFEDALSDKACNTADRVRAIEILTEHFGGVRAEVAATISKVEDPLVRARIAWSLGRVPCDGALTILLPLSEDSDARVQCRALEALADGFHESDAERIKPVLTAAFASSDKRVRLAAARLATLLPEGAWKTLPALLELGLPQTRLTGALATLWRDPAAGGLVLEKLITILNTTKDPEICLQAVRLIVLSFGDTNLAKPTLEVYSNYALAPNPLLTPERSTQIAKAVGGIFPSGDARLDGECARLLGILEDSDPATVTKVAAFITDKSSPTWDVHYLVVLSRLQGAYPPELAAKIANAILSLGKKLEGQEQRTKQVWGARLGELVGVFLKRDPKLASELVKHPDFPNAGNVSLLAAFKPEQRREAAARFLSIARDDKKFAWSEPLIELLSVLPPQEFFPALRDQWSNFGLRDAIVTRLAATPDEADREKFLFGVDSGNTQVAKVCVQALEKLLADESPKSKLALLHLLRRLINEEGQDALRKQVVTLVTHGGELKFELGNEKDGADVPARKKTYQPLFDAFAEKFPALAEKLNDTGDEDPAAWKAIVKKVPFDKGDAVRGEALFRGRGCQTCHAATGGVGPNLVGAANRFSREDLLDAIIYPSRDVAPGYRTTIFKMKDGQIYTGLIAFESAEGFIVQTGATTTVRVNSADIASQRPGTMSLMPNGLLKGMQPEEIADLYSYLRSMK